MEVERLHELFEIHSKENELAWKGNCLICKKETEVVVTLTANGFEIKGGAVYEKDKEFIIKCEDCFDKDPQIYQECEVYSRVVGYLRPTKQWNKAKKEEFIDRKTFNIN